MFLTIIVFALILSLLIFVHELGHFVTAKRAGVKIEEFGFGLPPRLFGVKRGETIYSLNWLPLGGFVRICGENGPDEVQPKDENRAFYQKSAGKRAKILTAGVAMNVVLAMALLGLGYWIGLPTIIEDADNYQAAKVQITSVSFRSPAQEAGLNAGDTIKELKFGEEIILPNKVSEIQNFINSHLGKEITVAIERGKTVLEKKVIPRINAPENEGAMGVGLARTAIVSYSFFQSLIKGIASAVNLLWFTVATLGGILWRLIADGQITAELSGPVGIYNLTGQVTQLGFIYILQLTALLSINLAIINILPFPALDGGRLLFLAIEKIKGSPVSRKIEGIIHTVGFVFLILLLVAITWRDVVRLL